METKKLSRNPRSSRKTRLKLIAKRDFIIDYLNSRKIETDSDFNAVLQVAGNHFGLKLRKHYTSSNQIHAVYGLLIQQIIKKHKLGQTSKQLRRQEFRNFYNSHAWRQLRYTILKKYGFRCLACGRSAASGATIHVDHKKPLRRYWHLRLDPDNLQPLCDWCNHGKGSWDETNHVVQLDVVDPDVANRLQGIYQQLGLVDHGL